MTQYHLAQINIARAVADLDSPLMKDFLSRLDEINALAEGAKGFVWRLQSDTGNAMSIRVFDDPRTYVNMSVWESPEDLKNFVYRSAHVELIRDREAWFSRLSEQHQAVVGACWSPPFGAGRPGSPVATARARPERKCIHVSQAISPAGLDLQRTVTRTG